MIVTYRLWSMCLRLRPSSLFGVTHWNNGKRRMSYYFLTFRNLQQCSVCFIGLNHVYVLNETGVYLFTPLYIKRRLVHAYNAFTNEIVCGVIYCVKLLIACRDCTWQAMSRPSIQCNMYTILRFFLVVLFDLHFVLENTTIKCREKRYYLNTTAECCQLHPLMWGRVEGQFGQFCKITNNTIDQSDKAP